MKEFKILRKYLKFIEFLRGQSMLYAFVLLVKSGIFLTIPLAYGLVIENITLKKYGLAYLLVGLYLLANMISYIFRYLENVVFTNFFRDTYNIVLRKYIGSLYSFSYDEIRKTNKSAVLNTVNTEVTMLVEAIDDILIYVTSAITTVFVFSIIATLNIYIGGIILLVNIANFYFTNKCNNKLEICLNKENIEIDKRTSYIDQYLKGYKEIKTYNIIGKLENKFTDINKEYVKVYNDQVMTNAKKYALIPFLNELGSSLILFMLIYLVSINQVSIATIIVLLRYYDKLIAGVNDIAALFGLLREINVAQERVENVFKLKENREIEVFGNEDIKEEKGLVKFENVSFSYNDENKILDNFNFEVKLNAINLLKGSSGTGKSTVFDLIMRLYRVDSGTITLDGVNIYDYSAYSYSTKIAYVSQDSFMFDMSIMDNLKLITENEEEIKAACIRAHADEFIKNLPMGYDTILENGGTNLSGGQRQRLAIVRAILKKSRVILLDEVTSSLDEELVFKIDTLIHELKSDHTIILISHNPHQITNADNIIDMEENIKKPLRV
ncbi:MAG: ABC transporter ATP-binding protein/permease [Clostridia bacterium]|jgi:ABC-type multidrug transport system fused ATPase/permease subunit|nr:ABC transporter ATP-binding protein/permease [Clostridia bacterium]